VAVLNDCKYGLSVKGNSINLTLLKSRWRRI
jgi:alpha-mannosidase